MKKRNFAAIFIVIALTSIAARANELSNKSDEVIAQSQKEKCSTAKNTPDLNLCMRSEYKSADQKMNAGLKELYSVLADNTGIRASQAAWLKFRDAECSDDVLQTSREQNSWYDVAKASCLIGLTEERSKKIYWHLAQDCNGCPARK